MSIDLPQNLVEPRLWVAPAPFKDESSASWIQRVSGEHQYSLPRLSEITGVNPPRGDWDAHVPNDQWTKLLQLASLAEHSCGEARFAMNTLRAQPAGLKHLMYSDYKPRYRWCSACFSNDDIPYLRWEWRLRGMTHCRVHRHRLKELCRWCGKPLTVHRALLVSSGPITGNLRLSDCGTCGMPLVEDEEEAEELGGHEDATINSPITSLIDRLRHAYWHDDEQMKFDFPEIEEDRETRGPVWFDLRINRLPTFTRELLPDTKWLNAGESGDHGTDRPSRWSDGLRPADRMRLVQALRIIRKEKMAMRLADLHGENRNSEGGER